jgi:hypothetical protein
VAELALDDDQRHAFARHLDGVGVTKLVRREAPAHASSDGCAAEFRACRGACPVSAAACAVDDAEQRPDGKAESRFEPWLEFLPSPGVHADFAASSALAVSDEQRAPGMVEIGFGEGEGFLDTQSGAPQDHDQATEPAAVRAVTGGAHDGDDLRDLRRICRVAQTLVAGRATRVESRHGRRRATSAGAV